MVVALAGVVVVAIGLLAMTGALSWFGRLPGDIRYSSGGARVYMPITTMIVVSIAVSVAAYVLRRLL